MNRNRTSESPITMSYLESHNIILNQFYNNLPSDISSHKLENIEIEKATENVINLLSPPSYIPLAFDAP